MRPEDSEDTFGTLLSHSEDSGEDEFVEEMVSCYSSTVFSA